MRKDLRCGRGETFTLDLRYRDTAGDGIDLTGDTVELRTFKPVTGEPLETHPAVVDDQGAISVHVADEDTATWPVKAAYRVVHIDTAGDERWLVWGALTAFSGVDL